MKLGNIVISRDWGWAAEYVDAMWRMLQLDTPDDFLVATGRSRKLEEFISLTFSALNLDWKDHVQSDPSLLRPSDIMEGLADPSKSREVLGWQAQFNLEAIVQKMVKAEHPLA